MAFTPTTWNPLDKGSAAILSNSDLTLQGPRSGACRSVFGTNSGKWYWEIASAGLRLPICGVALSSAAISDYPGSDVNGMAYYGALAQKRAGEGGISYGDVWVAGEVVGIALDMDAGTLTFLKDGVSMGVAFSGLTGVFYAMSAGDSETDPSKTVANFGASPFVHTPPLGFYPGFGEITPDPFALSGTVRDATNALASRKVAAYREDTNALVGTTTSDATTGVYSIESPVDTAHTLVFYPADGENLNALVRRGVLPIES